MIECPCRILLQEYYADSVTDNCPIKIKLLQLPKYRYYKALYEGRIKPVEKIIKRSKK